MSSEDESPLAKRPRSEEPTSLAPQQRSDEPTSLAPGGPEGASPSLPPAGPEGASQQLVPQLAASDAESQEADADDVGKAVGAAIAAATPKDSDSDSDSSSEAGDAAPAAKKDSSSDSESESESSSSSSSSSSSATEDEPAQDHVFRMHMEKAAPKELRRQKDFQAVRSAHLKRDELITFLLSLPEEVSQEAILRSFVRLTMNEGHVLAEVTEIVASPPYNVKKPSGEDWPVRVQLRCKRGSAKKLFKLTNISNQDCTEQEFEQWRTMTSRTGVDPDHYIGALDKKAEDIKQARNFKFTEEQVAAMLKRKGSLEFQAQKESEQKAKMQCALSQMHISGIRDSEAAELEERYKKALQALSHLEAESTKLQEEWFERRADVYSIKEVNRKNLQRQRESDVRALKYVAKTDKLIDEAEAKGEKAPSNPFERRPCRPVMAWDTKLTGEEDVEDVPKADAPSAPAEAPAKVDAPPAAAAAPPAEAAPISKVEAILKAHKSARLLSKLSSVSVLCGTSSAAPASSTASRAMVR